MMVYLPADRVQTAAAVLDIQPGRSLGLPLSGAAG